MLEIVNIEDIKGRTPEDYFEGRICCKCESDQTYIKNTGKPKWMRYYGDEGIWDGKSYLCSKCDLKIRQNQPGSWNNIQKILAKCRTRCLDRNSSTGKAFIDQLIVSRVFGINDMNLELDDFRTPVDMIHPNLRRIDVKSSVLLPELVVDRDIEYGRWTFCTHRKKGCDTYILLGYNSDRTKIIAVYIIPNDDKISSMAFINIRYGTRSSKYDKFKVDPNPYNDIYRSLDFENDPILRHIFK